ncbi:MAG: cation-translocating P-type ATPase [Planctomycetota bacterium]|nr:cation-translocating P-type ATPase [Planctomycetota bacterium]MDA1179851.1 cation-translocating P-type ATPase [Planctomycetota bacterium]
MQDRTPGGESTGALTRLGLGIFFTMNVMVFSMGLWTWEAVSSGAGSTAAVWRDLFRYGCLLFSAPVLLLLGGSLGESAWAGLRRARVTSDGLLFVGVLAAFAVSCLALLNGHPYIYFEVGCVILVFVTLGRWLEATGKLRATLALQSLLTLLPDTVRHICSTGEIVKPLADTTKGDLLRVLAGERVPVDGTVERHAGTLDEQFVTGESLPRTREVGENVYGGTLNLDADLYVRASGTANEGTVQRIVDRVAEAAATKGREQRLADQLTQWFTPAILLVVVATFGGHLHYDGFQSALMAALSVVVIACPCALGIATPLAVWAALSRAAQHQVLFRHGDALSRLARLRACCFDKTGTLSQGSVELTHSLYAPGTVPLQVDSYACQLSLSSNHVLGHALRKALQPRLQVLHPTVSQNHAPSHDDAAIQVLPIIDFEECRTRVGKGILAVERETGERFVLGSLAFAQQEGLVWHPPQNQRKVLDTTHVCVGWRGQVQAVYCFHEELREEAPWVVQELQSDGIAVRILTGDTHRRATIMAQSLGIEVAAELLPEQKLNAINSLRKQYGCVAMVGDGVNDAPALATADIGIALDCGADVSRDSADVCLLGSTLRRLPWVIRLARATRRTIYQNLFWALAYNVIGVGFAAAGNLNPILASVAMVGSSLFVIVNSLRLNSFEVPPDTGTLPAPLSLPTTVYAAAELANLAPIPRH